eukprot:16442002-Heterocapsa_arctica.AAC.1
MATAQGYGSSLSRPVGLHKVWYHGQESHGQTQVTVLRPGTVLQALRPEAVLQALRPSRSTSSSATGRSTRPTSCSSNSAEYQACGSALFAVFSLLSWLSDCPKQTLLPARSFHSRLGDQSLRPIRP